MFARRLVLTAAACLLASTALAADKPGETREVLALHETVAKFKSIAYQQCRGLTSMCPDNCGHSGDFATFDIVGYIKYTKNGEYGDPKTTSYTFQLNDNKKNLKVTKELSDNVRALKPGDTVLLTWQHDYVSRTEPGGGVSKFPDRIVTKLEKITPEAGEAKLKEAAPK